MNSLQQATVAGGAGLFAAGMVASIALWEWASGKRGAAYTFGLMALALVAAVLLLADVFVALGRLTP